jgi:hypothetical protein
MLLLRPLPRVDDSAFEVDRSRRGSWTLILLELVIITLNQSCKFRRRNVAEVKGYQIWHNARIMFSATAGTFSHMVTQGRSTFVVLSQLMGLLHWCILAPEGPSNLAAVRFTAPIRVSSIRIFPNGTQPFANSPEVVA